LVLRWAQVVDNGDGPLELSASIPQLNPIPLNAPASPSPILLREEALREVPALEVLTATLTAPKHPNTAVASTRTAVTVVVVLLLLLLLLPKSPSPPPLPPPSATPAESNCCVEESGAVLTRSCLKACTKMPTNGGLESST
jgi:hypothetical protein